MRSAEISKATFGLTPSEYKALKGLDRENLRDHMTDLELIFSMLGEASTTEIARNKDAQGFGREDGCLSQSELGILKDELISSPADKKIAIVMHHHLTPVGTPLIDHYILKNSKDFWEIVTGTNVKLIICGHVHGDYRLECNNIMIESSPGLEKDDFIQLYEKTS